MNDYKVLIQKEWPDQSTEEILLIINQAIGTNPQRIAKDSIDFPTSKLITASQSPPYPITNVEEHRVASSATDHLVPQGKQEAARRTVDRRHSIRK